MFEKIKKFREQEAELKLMTTKYETASKISDSYCGWTYAYKEAIYEMLHTGVITSEQKDLFFDLARKHYDTWQSQV